MPEVDGNARSAEQAVDPSSDDFVVHEPASERSEAESVLSTESTDDLVDDQADIAADFVEDLLDLMGIEAEVEISDVDGVTYVDVWAEDADALGVLIGRRGATLDGLQELVRSVVQRQTQDRCRVQVDIEDYRKRRRSQVIAGAQAAADRAKETGEPVALEPMSAYERKLVHDAIAPMDGLETSSEGEEPGRRVVVHPVE
jgi:spoIIIJ-associated protein